MPDKFPEAFERFEEKNPAFSEDWNRLKEEFTKWQRYQLTQLQESCLRDEWKTIVKEVNIPHWRWSKVSWQRALGIKVRTYHIQFRSIKSGRFVKGK